MHVKIPILQMPSPFMPTCVLQRSELSFSYRFSFLTNLDVSVKINHQPYINHSHFFNFNRGIICVSLRRRSDLQIRYPMSLFQTWYRIRLKIRDLLLLESLGTRIKLG